MQPIVAVTDVDAGGDVCTPCQRCVASPRCVTSIRVCLHCLGQPNGHVQTGPSTCLDVYNFVGPGTTLEYTALAPAQ
jgi:hypothetical protein